MNREVRKLQKHSSRGLSQERDTDLSFESINFEHLAERGREFIPSVVTLKQKMRNLSEDNVNSLNSFSEQSRILQRNRKNNLYDIKNNNKLKHVLKGGYSHKFQETKEYKKQNLQEIQKLSGNKKYSNFLTKNKRTSSSNCDNSSLMETQSFHPNQSQPNIHCICII
jgi:hypothetical protein